MKLPFDKTYCLHLVEAKDRYESTIRQFEAMGILDDIEYWYTCRRPFAKNLYQLLPSIQTELYDDVKRRNDNIYESVFNCSLEHYTIIKTSYERGLNSIAIIEDDISFFIDKDRFEYMISNIPSDYDVIQFHNQQRSRQRYLEEQLNIANLDKYVKVNNIDYWFSSTMFYALNRNGMKHFIELHDEHDLLIADHPFRYIDTSKYNFYLSPCEFCRSGLKSTYVK